MTNKSWLLVGVLFWQIGLVHASVPTNSKWLVNLDQGNGTVEFNAVGRPSALKIRGKGAAPKGTLTVEGTALSGAATFSLDSLDTGIKLRNEHMKKKYLETEKYPEAKVTFAKLSLPDSLKADGAVAEKVPFQGTLSLHGVEKPISGTAKIERKGGQVQLAADFGLKISDFGIATPGFAGITMAEDVQVLVQLAAPVTTQQ